MTKNTSARVAVRRAEHAEQREGDDSYLAFTTTIATGKYNQLGLAMYEVPNMIFAWALFLLRPRRADEPTRAELMAELASLRSENERLRGSLR